MRGAQSSGGSLVSFNANAYWSYGHEYSQNAPVSEYAAFAYTTALNVLLADRNHCKVLGDTTVVCWAENAGSAYADLGTMALFGIPADSGIQEEDVSRALPVCSWRVTARKIASEAAFTTWFSAILRSIGAMRSCKRTTFPTVKSSRSKRSSRLLQRFCRLIATTSGYQSMPERAGVCRLRKLCFNQL